MEENNTVEQNPESVLPGRPFKRFNYQQGKMFLEGGIRVVSLGGVHFRGALHGNVTGLQDWHGRRVLVRYLPTNDDKIWLYSQDGRHLICEAKNFAIIGRHRDFMPDLASQSQEKPVADAENDTEETQERSVSVKVTDIAMRLNQLADQLGRDFNLAECYIINAMRLAASARRRISNVPW
jgi:hypothetical protein